MFGLVCVHVCVCVTVGLVGVRVCVVWSLCTCSVESVCVSVLVGGCTCVCLWFGGLRVCM